MDRANINFFGVTIYIWVWKRLFITPRLHGGCLMLKYRTNLEAVLQPLMHLNYQIVKYFENTKSRKKICFRNFWPGSRQNVIHPWLIMPTSLPHLPPPLPIFKSIAPPCSHCSNGTAYSLKRCPRDSFGFKYTKKYPPLHPSFDSAVGRGYRSCP